MRNDFRNVNRGEGSFERRGYGRKSFDRGGRRGGNRQMHRTVCSNCGKDCEVPFRPTNNKPVYCDECFPKFSGRNNRPISTNGKHGFDERKSPNNGGSDNTKAQLDNLNNKLDRILKLLEKPAQVVEPVEVVAPLEVEIPKAEEIKEEVKKEKTQKKKAKVKKASKKDPEN